MGINVKKYKGSCIHLKRCILGVMAILTISYGSSMVAVTGMASMSRNFVPTMGCFFGLAFKKYGMPLQAIVIGEFVINIIFFRFHRYGCTDCNPGCYHRSGTADHHHTNHQSNQRRDRQVDHRGGNAMSEVRLEVKNLCKSFGITKAVQNVSFNVNKGEVHALIGENGSGKSTLTNMLTGIYSIGSGTFHSGWKRDPSEKSGRSKQRGCFHHRAGAWYPVRPDCSREYFPGTRRSVRTYGNQKHQCHE